MLTIEEVERDNYFGVDFYTATHLRYRLDIDIKKAVFDNLEDTYDACTRPGLRRPSWIVMIRYITFRMLIPNSSLPFDQNIITVYERCIKPAIFDEEEQRAVYILNKHNGNSGLIRKRI